jgi:hypothetical protein
VCGTRKQPGRGFEPLEVTAMSNVIRGAHFVDDHPVTFRADPTKAPINNGFPVCGLVMSWQMCSIFPVNGAEFWLSDEQPDEPGAEAFGGGSIRKILTVEDPVCQQRSQVRC